MSFPRRPRDGAHCRICGTGMIIGGHCNNSTCLRSPSYTAGGRKKEARGGGAARKPAKKWGRVKSGLLLAVALIALGQLMQ